MAELKNCSVKKEKNEVEKSRRKKISSDNVCRTGWHKVISDCCQHYKHVDKIHSTLWADFFSFPIVPKEARKD